MKPASWGRVILCDTSSREPRCIVLDDRRPDCDPRCGQYRQPEGYIEASDWADEMLEHHDQKRCPGCGGWTIWVPHVAADDLGRGGSS